MNWWRSNRRLGRALVASLALHACAAFLFPRLAATPVPGPEVLEKISFQKIARLSVRSPHSAAAARSAPSVAAPLKRPAVRARPQKGRKKAPARRSQAPVRTSPTPGASVQTRASAGAEAAAPIRVAPLGATRASAAPNVHPSANPAPAEPTNGRALDTSGGQQPFLAEQPPALETGALQELRHRFKMHATLIVEVSEDGKVKNVQVRPPASPDVQRQIRDLLAQAHWDPAVCPTGLTCDGTWTLDLAE
ncbi:MAG: hypothetical protein NVS1B14_03910 [Vulcanimicrobiaceae bacterium]